MHSLRSQRNTFRLLNLAIRLGVFIPFDGRASRFWSRANKNLMILKHSESVFDKTHNLNDRKKNELKSNCLIAFCKLCE